MVYWTAGLTEHSQRRGAIGTQSPVGIRVNTNLSKAYVFFLTVRLCYSENDRGGSEADRERKRDQVINTLVVLTPMCMYALCSIDNNSVHWSGS